ncbi:phosphoprotein 3 family protein [Schizosaccharomyces octosporus yFS286]|uniref:Vacuolar protein sorting-associated protein 74 n=1 Tax=Schizosaccharomyces octosporus (strain yFS286) TaxID=483514 RepID=S9Q5E5_SCHOY|nr:phosphoprotein 3 family protein [Schizosaccharomyces octosporus yFS286]EPX74863.1 phosphoprotein 3 family protein [Schizosaccharomyces octosporus yFS286]
MTSGLSRRRVVSGNSIENDQEAKNVALIKSKAAQSRDDDHKIAFDPKDLEQGTESEKQPKVTLMEEVLLLGLKDKQGYLSFWNDSISYSLRGCILIELAFRGRLRMQKDTNRKRFPLADRMVELVDDRLTGEVLLDEAIKMIHSSEPMSVTSWIDLMSGETWNVMKIGYQLRQVRERLAKGLVDKGILRTEKKNFLLFDMPTHPIADTSIKEGLKRRVLSMLTDRIVELENTTAFSANVQFRYLRTICLVCSAYAANVLENALLVLDFERRDRALAQVDELLSEFSQWPFLIHPSNIGANLGEAVGQELEPLSEDQMLSIEVVAAVLQVFTHLDSLL